MGAGPEISPLFAAGLAVSYTLLLVLPFYASPTTRPRPGLDRNDDRVIRTRMRLVTITSTVCTAATVTVLHSYLRFSWPDTLHLLGWQPVGWRESARALALVAVLFAGPLFEKLYAEERVARWMTGEALREAMRSLQWWRNIVVGPISEELLFRSSLVPLYLLSSSSSASSSSSHGIPLPADPAVPILLSPLPFALAHLHHLHESRLTHPHVPLPVHVAVAVLQFAYTALFGWFAALLFVRSGSLLACVGCHAFCNWMGLPRVWGRVGPRKGHDEANPVAAGVEKDTGFRGKKENVGTRSALVGTAVYYGLLVAGACAFRALVWEWTGSANGLVRR